VKTKTHILDALEVSYNISKNNFKVTCPFKQFKSNGGDMCMSFFLTENNLKKNVIVFHRWIRTAGDIHSRDRHMICFGKAIGDK